MIASASGHVEEAQRVLGNIKEAILFPLMGLLMALAVLVFMWGAFQFILNADDDGARQQGKSHMLWGVVGIVVMVSALAILKIAAGTFGVDVSPEVPNF